MTEEIERAVAVKVNSLEDLARLAASTAARLMAMPIYRFKWRGKAYYIVHLSFKDYYKKYGIPLIYYYSRPLESDVPDSSAKYILIKADDMGEKVVVTSKTQTGYVPIPLINLAGKPPFVPDDID